MVKSKYFFHNKHNKLIINPLFCRRFQVFLMFTMEKPEGLKNIG